MPPIHYSLLPITFAHAGGRCRAGQGTNVSIQTPCGIIRRHCRPGSPGWRPLPGSKAFGLQQPTGYHLFTIHSYLLPSPTQVGDAGRVRAVMYPIRTSPVASLSVVTDDKKSLADWRDFSVCVGITYLPGKSPCKYCRRR